MATITSLGIGSGIDANTIVQQLVALERRPLEQMQADARQINTRLSSMGQIQNLFSKLQDASSKLTGTNLWGSVQATSADATGVGVRAAIGAPAGSYQVGVQQLAASQNVVSTARLANSAELVGAGTLTFEVGTLNPTDTSAAPRVASIEVSATDTLANLRDKVNAANLGVAASIVTDASGSRLAFRSRDTGADNAFKVTVADGDGDEAAGLSRFGYDAASAANPMALTQTASNARATVNGIEIESPTNTVNNALEGLTLTFGKVTTAPVDVNVTVDTEAIKKGITDFATAYSELARYIGNQTRYDEATGTGGPLQGDSAATGLQSRLRSLVNTASGASPTLSRLSNLGLQLQRDGGLNVDNARLDSAMRDLTELRRALANPTGTDASSAGLARRFTELATAALGTDGSVTSRSEALRRELRSNQTRQDQVNTRAERTQRRLEEQYGALDRNASRLNGLQSFVSAQLSAMSNNNNR
jgi:flagellar hook-associated protein 2